MKRQPQYTLAEKREFARKLRENPTPAEALLWSRLRAGQLGHKFNRQSLVCGYIVDFWCHSSRLAVEVDGWIHATEDLAAADDEKERALESYGIGLLRFTNDEVFGLLSMVLDNILRECHHRGSRLLKGFALPTRSLTSSSSRSCPSLQKSGNNPAGAATYNALDQWKVSQKSVEIPQNQRITPTELADLRRRIVTLSRQRSMNFDDQRPAAKKVWEQRYKLAEKIRRKA